MTGNGRGTLSLQELGCSERWLSPQHQALTVFQVSLQLRKSEVTDQVFLKVAAFPLRQATPTADGWASREEEYQKDSLANSSLLRAEASFPLP